MEAESRRDARETSKTILIIKKCEGGKMVLMT